MLDIVCLWVGRIVLFIVGLILLLILLSIVIKGISVLLRKPYYCIKRLLPWKWVTFEEIKDMQRTIDCFYKEQSFLPKWKQDIKIIIKGRFGNLYIPNKANWWDSKNHYFIIKKS